MKVLYLDCAMGAAGDMLTAALIELLPDAEEFVQELNELGIPHVRFSKEKLVKCGITGTHMSVTIDGIEEESFDHHECAHSHDHTHEHVHAHSHVHTHEHEHAHVHSHSHRSIHDIAHIVNDHLPVSEKVKRDVLAVYGLIAEAESAAHDVPVTEIHFHEVGTMDAVADVTAVCMLMERLAPDQVIASPIHVGSGQVHCAHGILPVPAPATAYILKDVPMYGGKIKGELCTPTGAALLKHFVTRFGSMPMMKISAIGYGMGKKDFEAANCVRAMLGETGDRLDDVLELSCNVDDMTAEQIGFAMERFLENGALDVYTIPIGMKKSRPGVMINILCKEDAREKLVGAVFRHTTTLGIRESRKQRYVLERQSSELQTAYGMVRCKTASGYGVSRSKYEYEDMARIAVEQGMSIAELRDEITREMEK